MLEHYVLHLTEPLQVWFYAWKEPLLPFEVMNTYYMSTRKQQKLSALVAFSIDIVFD